MISNLKSFSEFRINEGLHLKEDQILLESDPSDKSESYRTIAYNLSEIFGLYGFFFAQKPGFMSQDQWKKYMSDIVKIGDPSAKWKKITDTVSEFQNKVSSPEIFPSPGEFGHLGTYSYETETSELPLATKLLQDAHNAVFKTFTPAEKTKAMSILNTIILGTKALALNNQ
jgi:hypothetical protein